MYDFLTGASVASVNGGVMYPNIADMGIYASASITAVHSRKETEIWEVCHTMLNKVPRGWNRVSVLSISNFTANLIITWSELGNF